MLDMKQLVEQERPKVYKFVNELFDVSPPEPKLYVNMQETEEVPILIAKMQGNVSGHYLVEDRTIVIDPLGLIELREERKEDRMTINPKWQATRVLAKMYASHCISFLYDFQLSQKTAEYWTQINPHTLQDQLTSVEWFIKMGLPAAKYTGVSHFAFLQTAKNFQHRDDYLLNFDMNKKLACENAQNMVKTKRNVDVIKMDKSFYLPSIGIVQDALSYLFVETWRNTDIRRELAYSIFGSPDEKEIEDCVKYLMGDQL